MDTQAHTAPALMAASLRARADANGLVNFADFSREALFHPQEGYYTRNKKRVGLTPKADFYTASSVGPVFGKLVAEAAAALIAPDSPAEAALVEIGAESGAGVFETLYGSATAATVPQTAQAATASQTAQTSNSSVAEPSPAATHSQTTQASNSAVAEPSPAGNTSQTTQADNSAVAARSPAAPIPQTVQASNTTARPTADNQPEATLPPFASVLTLPLGHDWQWPQKAVIFANELLDAQPFHRLQLLGGRWREWGVRCDEHGHLSEVLMDALSEPVATALAAELPLNLPEGSRLDISLEAEALLGRLLSGDWQGAFLLFDYGKNWQELLNTSPAGTARAYRNHRLSTDLLATPGEQDLTCHVCWDRLERIATAHGFTTPHPERQEAFFMRYAPHTIARVIGQSPAHFDPQRQALMSLLHPAHLGSKFQVLHGRRINGGS